MRYVSNAAAIACCAVVAMGMTGCNSSSSTTTTTETTTTTDLGGTTTTTPIAGGTTTPTDTCVPAEVKAAATLDQNNTKAALSATLIIQEIGEMLSYGGMYMNTASEKSAQEPKKVSKLASMVSAKIQTLQKTTADVKKSVSMTEDGSLIYGDDVACDVSGTYSFHEADSEGSEDDTQIYMEKLTLSFNACVMEDIDSEKLNFFQNMTLYSSIIGNSESVEAIRTYTFNGSLSLEYNSNYTNSSDYWNDDPQPLDSGSNEEYSSSGTSHWVTNGISVEYKEDGTVKSHFASTEKLSVTFNGTNNYEYNTTYETDVNEGNYTTNTQDMGQNTWNATFEGSESEQMFGDVNTTVSLTACDLSIEGTSTYSNMYTRLYENWNQVSYESTYEGNVSTELSGYLTLQDGDQEFDLYGNELMVNNTYADMHSNNYQTYDSNNSNTSELSLNGTVGSTLLGGSVVLDTQNPWLMSSEYPDHRNSMVLENIIGYGYVYPRVDYSPYAGKTVLTGTNSAVVEFMLDEENLTYGTITVGDEDPVEYDSIEDMGIAQIYNYNDN